MSQESLDLGFLDRVAPATKKLYEALDVTAHNNGMLRSAGACGIDNGDLRRALDRNGRRVAVEHALAVAAIADYEHRKRIAKLFANALGFEVVDEQPRITDKERADRYERALLSFGEVGLQKRDEALGGRR